MKKITVLFVLLSVVFLLMACSVKEEYAVYEIGGYDYTSGADHNEEFSLKAKENVEFKLFKEKKIKYSDAEFNTTYERTRTGYLYNSKVDCYTQSDGLNFTKFEINTETGRIDCYSWMDMGYLEDPDLEEKSREECLKIAREYLTSYTDEVDAYDLVDEKFRESPEFGSYYNFLFARSIDGVMTADMAGIRVTMYGTVIYHGFECFGEMRGAELPDQEKMSAIQVELDKKLDSIYEPINEDYAITYKLDKTIFERLADGRYALEYFYEVKLTSQKNESAVPHCELTRLIVILENN